MAKTEKRRVGDAGEGVVCRYLEGKGYKVIERNYWKPWGEIDVIAEKGDMTIFIEVKSTSVDLHSIDVSRESADRRIRPEEHMHPEKIKRLYRTIQTYLLERRIPENKPWRLDLACAYLDFSTLKAKVEILENVVL
jgi:putative endonuclease